MILFKIVLISLACIIGIWWCLFLIVDSQSWSGKDLNIFGKIIKSPITLLMKIGDWISETAPKIGKMFYKDKK